MKVQEAAIQILKDAGKPLHAKEIAKRIIDVGLWKSEGKTPDLFEIDEEFATTLNAVKE